MKLKQLIFLLVLLIGMGAYIYWGIQKPAEEKQATDDYDKQLIKDDLSQLAQIEIKNEKGSFILEKGGNTWKLLGPHEDIASSTKVETLISALLRIKADKILYEAASYPEAEARLDDFGLGKLALEIGLQLGASAEPRMIRIGRKNPGGSLTYIDDKKNKRIILSPESLDILKSAEPKDYREMRLTTVEAHDYADLSVIQSGKKMRLERNEKGDWVMKQPWQLPLDQSFTNNQISKIPMIRANEFLAKTPPAFSKPSIQLIVGFKEGAKDLRSGVGDKRPQGLEIQFARSKKLGSKNRNDDSYEYFAKSDKTAAARIPRFHYENFEKGPEAYIQKSFENFDIEKVEGLALLATDHLFGWNLSRTGDGWLAKSEKQSISDPNQDEIKNILDSLKRIRGLAFEKSEPAPGFTQLLFQISLKLKDGQIVAWSIDKKKQTLWISFGGFDLRYKLDASAFDEKKFAFQRLVRKTDAVPAANKVDVNTILKKQESNSGGPGDGPKVGN
ncbi:MAG: hypothetical protein COV44_08275 [Deltaproteobacteria bacterium CG11_big_fil_rev_8_21_14_0_20_45_16]|nr:MAG: hypothetical protein COV44_08275 [Deltaproteobacteria bacterium CG11_big_fil_rev_8_21_14_0_20_45_16]